MSVRSTLGGCIALVAAAAPWAFGAVDPSWSAALAFVTLTAGALWFVAGCVRPHPAAGDGRDAVAAIAVPLVAAATLLPLPHAIRSVAAPWGTRLLDTVSPDTADGWRPLTLSPTATVGACALAAAYAVAFLALRRLAGSPRGRTSIAGAIAASGVGLAVEGVLQHVTQRGELQPRIYWTWQVYEAGTPFGPYVNRNHFAGAMVVMGSVAAGEALASWAARRRATAAVWGACALAMLSAIAVTTSRGGALAAAVAVAVLVFALPAGKRFRGLALVLPLVAIVGAVLTWTGALDPFLDRIVTLSGRWTNRFGVQRDALAAFAGNPVLGTGAGTFEDVYPAFQRVCDDRSFQNAHSDWAQILMETGLAGLVAAALCVRRVASWLRTGLADATPDRWRVLGPAAGAVGVAVHGLFEVNLHVPANALLTVCALSLASAAAGRDSGAPPAGGAEGAAGDRPA